MNARKWLRVLVSGAIVLVTAGAVVFVGRNAAEGDPTWPSDMATPDPELVRKADEAFERYMQDSLEADTSTIEINGQTVDLPAGLRHTRQCKSEGLGCEEILRYTNPAGRASPNTADSWVRIKDGVITEQRINSGDVDAFGGVLELSGQPSTDAAAPTPQAATIAGHSVPVPPGVSVYVLGDTGRGLFAHSEPGRISRLYVDLHTGEVTSNEILQEHRTAFEGLLQSLEALQAK
jgi:hypothetical protein